ncbi:MAG: SGNH/GDSL hydrolase family protein [Paracoccaceae bacterium]
MSQRTGRRRYAAAAGLASLALAGAFAWWLGTRGVFGPGDLEAMLRPSAAAPVDPPAAIRDATADRAPKTLVMLGASHSARGRWLESVAAELSACQPAGVAVRRVARPGAGSDWGLARMAEALGAGTPDGPPDALVVHFAGNDASLWHGMSLAESARIHAEIIARARAAGVPVYLATMSPAWGRESAERPGHRSYVALYRAFAAEARGADRVGLIDTYPAWQALETATRQSLVPDDLHPNGEGMHRITVPAFVAALRPVICRDGA